VNTDFVNKKPEQVTPQAYVLAGDVANTMEARERIRELATL